MRANGNRCVTMNSGRMLRRASISSVGSAQWAWRRTFWMRTSRRRATSIGMEIRSTVGIPISESTPPGLSRSMAWSTVSCWPQHSKTTSSISGSRFATSAATLHARGLPDQSAPAFRAAARRASTRSVA